MIESTHTHLGLAFSIIEKEKITKTKMNITDKEKKHLENKYNICILCNDYDVTVYKLINSCLDNCKTIKLTKTNILEKLENKISNWINGNSSYTSLTELMRRKLNLSRHDLSVYPTSYGVGFDNFFNSHKIEEITNVLDNLGVKYRTESSDANWITRIIISKEKTNLNKF